MTETIDFTMHPKMLCDIIERQAGTVEKAVLEATMNAAEAGATKFVIDFTADDNGKRLVMTDNGKGIKTRSELEQHFKQFGTPHEVSENKKWAQFRMGRGQCFAQGKNVWRTCGWIMSTDIRADVAANRLPRFDLSKSDKVFNGCQIEIDLYANKFYGTIESLKDAVKEQIEFVDMDVIFNGEKINRAPDTLTWTYEDDDAVYLFGVGQDLIIYNMGVKVQKIPACRAGTIGVIVSKAQLKVNFARNEVLTDCPIMARIDRVVKDNRIKKTRKASRRLNKEERIASLFDLRDDCQTYSDLKSVGLFYTTSGRSLTFRDILGCRTPWTFGNSGDIVCDKLMQAGQALCIDRVAVDELNYSGAERSFFGWLTRTCYGAPDWNIVEGLYRRERDLKDGFNEDSTFVPRAKWTKKERRLCRVLEGFNCWDNRAIVIGVGPAYNAWTDGSSYIALERDFIHRSVLTAPDGVAAFFATMIHECAHTDSTTGSHVHGEAFYRAFHNLIRYGNVDGNHEDMPGGAFRNIPTFIDRMAKAIRDENVESQIIRDNKAQARVDKALGGVTAIAAERKTVTTTKRIAVPRKKRRTFGKRRMPLGAE